VQQDVFSLAPEEPTEVAPRNKTSVIVVGVLAAVALVAVFLFSQRMDNNARHYDTSAAGQPLVTLAPTSTAVPVPKFYAADARFRAVFDHPPKRTVESFTVDGKRYSMTVYDETNADSELSIGSMPLAPGTQEDLQKDLEGVATIVGARIGSTYAKTFQGNQAYEGVIAAGCGCDLVKAFMMIVRTNDRVVFIFGGADQNSEQRYVAFRDSVELL
jgi:hypothetical protein